MHIRSSFIQGDFTEPAVYDQILSMLNDDKVDVVVSDIVTEP